MDLKIKYNKDKSHMQVTLTLVPARYVHEQKMYDTSYILRELNKKGIPVTNDNCIDKDRTRVFNYTGSENCTGTWVFAMPKPRSATPAPNKKDVNVSSTKSKKTVKTGTKSKKITKRV